LKILEWKCGDAQVMFSLTIVLGSTLKTFVEAYLDL